MKHFCKYREDRDVELNWRIREIVRVWKSGSFLPCIWVFNGRNAPKEFTAM
jgi:hypothetical protein